MSETKKQHKNTQQTWVPVLCSQKIQTHDSSERYLSCQILQSRSYNANHWWSCWKFAREFDFQSDPLVSNFELFFILFQIFPEYKIKLTKSHLPQGWVIIHKVKLKVLCTRWLRIASCHTFLIQTHSVAAF